MYLYYCIFHNNIYINSLLFKYSCNELFICINNKNVKGSRYMSVKDKYS